MRLCEPPVLFRFGVPALEAVSLCHRREGLAHDVMRFRQILPLTHERQAKQRIRGGILARARVHTRQPRQVYTVERTVLTKKSPTEVERTVARPYRLIVTTELQQYVPPRAERTRIGAVVRPECALADPQHLALRALCIGKSAGT